MAKGFIVTDEEKCKECGYCILFCPQKIIEIGKHLNSHGYHPAVLIDLQGKCTGCGICYTVCPDVAIIKVYRETKIKGGN